MDLRNEVLAIQDMKVEPFPTPEWPSLDGKIFIRTISSHEAGMIDKLTCSSKTGDLEHMERVVPVSCAMYLSDAEGNRIFTDGDAQLLGQKSPRVLTRAFRAGRALNGLSKEGAEELEKNSEPITTGDSGIPFPLPSE